MESKAKKHDGMENRKQKLNERCEPMRAISGMFTGRDGLLALFVFIRRHVVRDLPATETLSMGSVVANEHLHGFFVSCSAFVYGDAWADVKDLLAGVSGVKNRRERLKWIGNDEEIMDYSLRNSCCVTKPHNSRLSAQIDSFAE